jgi:S-DNA-T family DNA segregation ATPase FtsK/SpoIIIE
MQAAIEKRGKELIGIALVVLGVVVVAMLGSYSADDPSFMLATDAPVQNLMGRLGASIAAPLMMIVGMGSWGLAIALLAWGFRFGLHLGEGRALGRVILTPIWMAGISVYAATLAPGPEWGQGFGLGGHFGDTVLGVLLNILPFSMAFGIKMLSLVFAVLMLALGAYVLGFNWPEIKRLFRYLMYSVVMAYVLLLNVLGRSASGAISAAQTMQARKRERAERRAAAPVEASQTLSEEWVEPFDQPYAAEEWDEPAPEPQKPSLLLRVPGLIRRADPMPAPELVDPQPTVAAMPVQGDDRIKAKIADVIRNRAEAKPEAAAPLTRGRGRGPDALLLDTSTPAGLPPEPPLTASRTVMPEPEAFDAQPEYLDDLPTENIFDTPADPTPHEALPQVDALSVPIPVEQPRKVMVKPLNRKPIQPSTRAKKEAQPSLQFDETAVEFELPPLNLLTNPANIQRHHLSDEALEENARMLENVLDDYGVKGEIVSVRPGPVVTMYELEPAPGLKASRVIGLSDDIARSMAALSARVSTVPGRSVIGIELPNENREKVVLREILSARSFGDANMKLPLALGKDIGGEPIVANLAKMPHLLIAGTTGSGKSVAINTMLLSLLYRLPPEECRMIMIDPKMLELSVYDGIPHLLSPVVTDPKKAVVALKWGVGEMEDRYRKMSKMGVRNIDGYNSRVADALAKNETFSRTVQTGFDDETGDPVFETEEITPVKMPYIVVVVDEMADLMMVAGKEIEACIQRLAQMARASGIHIIMATQRPSVDVITGTIKANFPTRISFQVTSKVDSRTILGEMGAEQLLGMGDMLYMAGGAKITRCHGPFVSDEEVEEIVNHLKSFGPPDYVGGVVEGPDDDKADNIDAVLGLNTGGNTDGEDALYDTAVAIVIKDRKCSTSYIQRKLAIGYNKAARLVEQMEEEGLVSPANHVGKREILVPEQQ